MSVRTFPKEQWNNKESGKLPSWHLQEYRAFEHQGTLEHCGNLEHQRAWKHHEAFPISHVMLLCCSRSNMALQNPIAMSREPWDLAVCSCQPPCVDLLTVETG